jgi:predicted membrane protein
MARLIRFLIKFAMVWGAMWLIGRLASRAFEGETTSDDPEFRILGFLGGRAVTSRAQSLRRVTVQATLGGIDLDLRQAVLDPAGAHLALKVTAGGMRVAVPPTWRVYVADDVRGGAVEVNTEPPDGMPADAPALTVTAVVRSGGVVIDASD